MRPDAWRWLLVLWLLAVAGGAWAAPGSGALVPPCTTTVTQPGTAGIIAVPANKFTPDEVLRLPAARFRTGATGQVLGHGQKDWWLRLELRNDSDRPCHGWLQVGPENLRHVHVYVPDDNGWAIMRGGSGYPLDAWALPQRQPVFPIVLAPHATTTILARVTGSGELVSLEPRLWNPAYFQRVQTYQALRDGIMYGGMLLLVLSSLILAWIFRSAALCYIALAAGFYTIYTAAQANYLFVHLWPAWPHLNTYLRFFLSGMFMAAGYRYLYVVLDMPRIGYWWARLFDVICVLFVLIAVFGYPVYISGFDLGLIYWVNSAARWLLLVVLVVGLWRGRMRHWFPPLLVMLLFARYAHIYGYAIGLPLPPPGETNMFGVSLYIGVLLLLGTMLHAVWAGRRAELDARATLDRQRATESERLERTVAQRTGELNRALRARREMLGRASHDLRSPLAGMLDAVRQWRAGDDGRDYPQLIERHASQQLRLIDDLLEFSHTELSELEPQPIPGYLYAFLNEVAEQAELTAEGHGNRLRRHFADNLPSLVSLEFHYLQRVLVNLLGNASKFTERGRIHFAVTARPADAESQVRLRFIVDDSGPGIAPADRERLLQPFARGATSTQQQGHGLGLAIVTQLLEHLGGQLQIGDAPGGGSRFHFELVADRAAEGDLEPVLEEGGLIDIDGAGRGILVVDDDPQQREITCDLLDGYGFDSVAAADGHAALDVLRTRPVDLVLTDQYMDGLDGWGLLQGTREQHPAVPVVLYSALPPQRPSGMADSLAFDVTILKPADGVELLRAIASLVDGADAQDARTRVAMG